MCRSKCKASAGDDKYEESAILHKIEATFLNVIDPYAMEIPQGNDVVCNFQRDDFPILYTFRWCLSLHI